MPYRNAGPVPAPMQPSMQPPSPEMLAKERRSQAIIGVIVVAIIVALLGFAAWALVNSHQQTQAAKQAAKQASSPAAVAEKKEALANVSPKPARVDDDGAVIITSHGVGNNGNLDVPTVTFYTEPLCPGCAAVHQELDSTLKTMVLSGQINLKVVPLVFQDNKSSDRYSTRAMDGFLQFIQSDLDPSHALDYLANIYAKDFQPGELDDYKPVSNLQLAQQAVKAGVDPKLAASSFAVSHDDLAALGLNPASEPHWDNYVKDIKLKYAEYLKADNAYNTVRPELFAPGADGFSSPTLTINGHYWSVADADKSVLGLKGGFLHALGLTESQVGDDTADGEASIGAKGEPIPLTASVNK